MATSTGHYGTIANYPPSVNAADVLRSRHLGQTWHRLGFRRMFISFEGCIVDPVPDPAPDSVIDADADVDDVGPDLSVSPASPINEEIEEVQPPWVVILAGILFMQMTKLILFRICLWKFLA